MNIQQATLWLKDNNFRLTSRNGVKRVDWMQDGEHQFISGKFQTIDVVAALQNSGAKSDYMMAEVIGD